MSDDRNKPYNLRSKRTSAGGASEGFIRASELLRLNDERSGVVHQATQEEHQGANTSQELVPDIPSNDDDEGGSSATVVEQSEVAANGNQGLPNSSGEAQGQQQPPTHSPVAQQEDECPTEVLRLRVQVRNTKTHKVEYVWVPINMLI